MSLIQFEEPAIIFYGFRSNYSAALAPGEGLGSWQARHFPGRVTRLGAFSPFRHFSRCWVQIVFSVKFGHFL